jgi:hypothetical protein
MDRTGPDRTAPTRRGPALEGQRWNKFVFSKFELSRTVPCRPWTILIRGPLEFEPARTVCKTLAQTQEVVDLTSVRIGTKGE